MIYIIEENVDRMGGVERIVSILANFFSKESNVKVISMYSNNCRPFFEYDSNVHIEYLKNKCNNKNRIINKFEYFFDLRRKINIVCKKIDSTDILIFGRVSVAVKFLPYIKADAKIIIRDAINIYNHSKIVKMLMKKYFPTKVKKFIVSSNESLKEYNKFFKKNNVKMIKIYNPLGIKPKLNYNYNNKIIGSVGRYDNQKGFENLIRAFKIVSDKYPDWRLKIIGDGPLRKNYEKLIDELHLYKKIELVHSCKKIEDILCNVSIFVMTSRFEGYANALVEALACGVPSISYNWLTGVEEIVDNNKNGIIVKLKDRMDYYNGLDDDENIINLSNAIINLIDNPSLCKNMSKSASEIVKSRNSDVILSMWDREVNEND